MTAWTTFAIGVLMVIGGSIILYRVTPVKTNHDANMEEAAAIVVMSGCIVVLISIYFLVKP